MANIILIAALALMFWFFDLTILAWIFGALVLVPLVIGFFIWIFKGLTSQTVVHESEGYGAYQPTVDNTTTPPRKPDFTEWDEFVAKEQNENIKTQNKAAKIISELENK